MNLTTDRKYALVMLAMSIVYCSAAFTLDADFDPVNEKYYSFCLSIIMIGLSLALFVRPSEHTTTWPDGKSMGKIAVTAISILIYTLLLDTVGFIICASVLMGVCMWVFGAVRKWIVPTSIMVAISFYVVFDKLLGLALPSGILKIILN